MKSWQHAAFAEGARDMLAVAPGIAAWGLMTGVAMVNSGLSTFESLAMALTVFAGSSQLAAMPLMLAGAPVAVIWATAFCVNLRFVVFSLHLRPFMLHLPLWRRLLGGYLVADLTYVIFTQRFAQAAGVADASRITMNSGAAQLDLTRADAQYDQKNTPEAVALERDQQQAYLLGNSLVNWASWVFPCVAGVLLANLIPQRWGLGFAGILALVGIACSLISTRLRAASAVIAGAAGVVAFALPLRLNIVVAIAVAVVVCLSLERFELGRKSANDAK